MTEEQWRAIRHRDKAYDGVFFYGCLTTKVVCRPSCPAQPDRPGHVVIFDSLGDALDRGYRPCLRCRPDQPDWRGAQTELAENARALIEAHYTEKFSTQSLAQQLFVNADYLSRVFKQAMGCTLLQYHNRMRCRRAKQLLESPELKIGYISDVVGYRHASHFTRVFAQICGCTPQEYRAAYLARLEQGE